MIATIEQYKRVGRALVRIKQNRNRDMVGYEDDVWNFFQNAWHLKDWVKNDPDVELSFRDNIEDLVSASDYLQICADLANRSKHLRLTRKRVDADISSKGIHIQAGTAHISLNGESTSTPGHCDYIFIIRIDGGKEFNVIEVAETIVETWHHLLIEHGVDVP